MGTSNYEPEPTKEAQKANAEAPKTTKINLNNDITVNGVRFNAGHNVEVPANQADDLMRMDYEHSQYLANLNRKNKYEVDSGTIAVGSGAE